MTSNAKDSFIDQISDMIYGNLKVRDLRAIAEAAEYDIEKVDKACKVLDATNGRIDNITGFLIKAIKEGYEAPVQRAKKGSFNEFQQNSYDYDIIEAQLLDN